MTILDDSTARGNPPAPPSDEKPLELCPHCGSCRIDYQYTHYGAYGEDDQDFIGCRSCLAIFPEHHIDYAPPGIFCRKCEGFGYIEVEFARYGTASEAPSTRWDECMDCAGEGVLR